MKPLHRLLLASLKYALIMVSAFVIYERIVKWRMSHSDYNNIHAYGHLIHLIIVFFVYFVIGSIVYYLFDEI